MLKATLALVTLTIITGCGASGYLGMLQVSGANNEKICKEFSLDGSPDAGKVSEAKQAIKERANFEGGTFSENGHCSRSGIPGSCVLTETIGTATGRVEYYLSNINKDQCEQAGGRYNKF